MNGVLVAEPRGADDDRGHVVGPPPIPATLRLLAVTASIGVAGDVAFRSGISTLGGALGAVAVAAGMLASGRLVTTQSKVLTLVAASFGVWVGVRSSVWLLPLDVLAATSLFVVAALFARQARLFDIAPRRIANRSAIAIGQSFDAVAYAFGPLRGRRSIVLLRGVLLAAPVVVTVVALLASADRVFASLIGIEALDAGDVVEHLVLFTVASWVGATLLRLASSDEPDVVPATARPLGAPEATILLGAIAAVLALFGVAQVIDVVGASDRIVGTEHADYARSGFFQLLWVAAIVMATVTLVRGTVRLTTPADERRIRYVSVVTCLLTLLVVAVSIRRLALYQDTYGLTMLRLYSTIAAFVIGVMLVLIALAIAGVGRDRCWLPGAALTTALIALFALNLINPEAVVARVNLDRDDPVVETDGDYLTSLSDDAVPTIVSRLDRLEPAQRAQVVRSLCERFGRPGKGLSANRSETRAYSALIEICTPLPFTSSDRG